MSTTRKIVIALVCILFPLVIWILLRLTHVADIYSLPTTSMEPTILQGDIVFCSNRIEPQRNSIVAYKPSEYYPGEKTDRPFLGRITAMPGDTLIIKDGICYVNGRISDDTCSRMYYYKCNLAKALKIIQRSEMERRTAYFTADSVISFFTPEEVTRIDSVETPRRLVLADTLYSPAYRLPFTMKWSVDNFGPLVIPGGYCFIMGDNRHNATDSRFRGPVRLTEVISVKTGNQ